MGQFLCNGFLQTWSQIFIKFVNVCPIKIDSVFAAVNCIILGDNRVQLEILVRIQCIAPQ